MKDNPQTMSITQKQSLKALPPPMLVKVSALFTPDRDEDDVSEDESVRLQVSDDEDEEVKVDDDGDAKVSSSTAEAPNESEDDILNKFDTVDGSAPGTDDERLEERLLGEDESEGDAAKDHDAGAKLTDGDCGKDDKSDGGDGVMTRKEGDCVGGSENDATESARTDVVKGGAEKVDGEGGTAMVGSGDVSKEVSTTTAEDDAGSKAEDEAHKKKVNAEFLKDQIMDTEDLLQIVDKQSEENDKESTDKGDSDDDTEKMDCDDTDKMDDETADGVDIEENNLSKPEFDAELDIEYDRMAKNKDTETDKASSKNGVDSDETTKETDSDETMKETDSESGQSQDTLMDKSTPKISDDKEKHKATTIDDVKEAPSTNLEEATKPSEKEETLEKTGDSSPSSADPLKTSKRGLSNVDEGSAAKKIKLTEKEDESTKKPDESITGVEQRRATPPPQPPAPKFDHLNPLTEYMRLKNLKRFSFRDLEILCVQKVCEAICHKSEIGELRHQLGVQEQMVEMWRKEMAQLLKQARDLEIVNKRLLHEVRLKNERDKPLIPVKITRSVGLQVRSDNSMLNNVVTPVRRRIARPSQQGNLQNAIAPAKQNRIMAANRAANAGKVIASSKVMTMTSTKVTTTHKVPVANKMMTTTRTVPATKTATPVKAITTIKTIPPVKTTAAGTKAKMTPVTRVLMPMKTMTPPTAGPQAKATLPKPGSLLSLALQNSTAPANGTSSSPTTPTAIAIPGLTPLTAVPTLTLTAAPINTLASGNKTITVTSKAAKVVADKTVIDLTDEDDKKAIASPNSSTGVRIITAPVKSGTVVSTAGVVNPPRIMYMFNNQLHEGVLTDMTKPGGAQKLQLVKVNSNVIGSNGVLTAVQNGSAITVSSPSIRTAQVQQVRMSAPASNARTTTTTAKSVSKHPAPLPPPPASQISLPSRKPIPPKPHLSIKRANGGLILSWKMPYTLENFEAIASYQLYAYQETSSAPSSEMWRKVGDVKALALPMACTLTQFADGNKYHFAVRAVDVFKRMGPFSDPEQILL